MFQNVYALIIEDDMSDADVLQTLLLRLGFQCDYVDNRGLFDALGDIPRPDIIFLDLQMPGMDGYQVLEELHAIPELAGIPIVAYTAHLTESQAAKRAGFHSFLGKPLKSSQLAGQLQRIMNNEHIWEVR